MHHSKPLILLLWFGTTPFVVVLFAKWGWGPDGVLAAIALSSFAWWLISCAFKKAMGVFPDKTSALHFLASGQVRRSTDIVPYEREEQYVDETGDDELYEEEEQYPQTGAIGGETSDLHPALVVPGMPTRPVPEHRYRLNLGSHTLDLDTALDQTLIDERLPEGARSLTRILAEEFGGRLRFALVIVDFTDGFQTLLTELPSGFLLGGFEKHNALPEQLRRRAGVIDRGTAAKLGRSLMQERGQCIFRFSSFESYVEASVNLLLFLQGIYRWEKEHVASGGSPVPCVIMLNQAHLFLPHDNTYSVASADPAIAQLLPTHLLHYLKAHGDYGMYLYLISEYASRMTSEVLAECGLWLLREPQYEELYYLSQVTRLNLMAQMRNMPAEQALLLDVVARKSFPVILRQSKSLPEVDGLFFSLPPTLTMAALAAPNTVPAPQEYTQAASYSAAAAGTRVTTTEGLSEQERSGGGEKTGETPGDFPEAWLAYASYLYSTGRLTSTALRRIPDQLFDLARALGLRPIKGQEAMNRHRALRLMGIVQGMSKEKRGKYARQARQHAPAQPQSAWGGAGTLGPGPPGSDASTPWELPRHGLLKRSQVAQAIPQREVRELAKLITRLLAEYDVHVDIREEDCSVGHTITRYAARPTGKPKLRLNPATQRMEGVRDPGGLLLYDKMTTVDQIEAKEEDLATKLAADTVRIARVPNKPFVGIEIPHREEARMPVQLRDILSSAAYQEQLARSKVLFPLGKDVAGEIRFLDLSNPDHPHLLIGGASGGGKSIFLRAGIASIAMQATPDEVRMWMVDPKMVEFTPFSGLPHLIGDIVTDIEAIPQIIKHALAEVMRRYEHFKRLGVTNMEEYRRLLTERSTGGGSSLRTLPELMLIIDELGDALMVSPQEVEEGLCRLGQIGRAAGLHLILATQRPEVKIVTGRIKANLPYRVALRVSSVDDSKVVIGRGGAQLLVGHGDLLAGMSGRLERLQGAYIVKDEVDAVVSHWRRQAAKLQPASPFIAEQSPPDEQGGRRDRDGAERQEEESGALLLRVIAELPQRRAVSVKMLKEVYRVSHQTAKPIIEQLQERGLIGEYNPSLKGHPVRVVNIQQRIGPELDQENGEERSLTS